MRPRAAEAYVSRRLSYYLPPIPHKPVSRYQGGKKNCQYLNPASLSGRQICRTFS